MHDRGILNDRELQAIRRRDLFRFYASPVGRRLLASDRVEREWHFNRFMGNMLLQGVIDCAFLENGCWVVVDYKTDYIEDEGEFVRRYAPQLTLYGEAVTAITGIPVAEMNLFALRLGRACRVEAAGTEGV